MRLLPELVAPEVAPAGGRSPAMGAFGSPADCVLGVPPVGPLPTLLVPEAWARIILSLSADACAAKGTAKAAATATASNFLSFIAVSWLNEKVNFAWPSQFAFHRNQRANRPGPGRICGMHILQFNR